MTSEPPPRFNTRRKSVFAEAYDPEADEDDTQKVIMFNGIISIKFPLCISFIWLNAYIIFKFINLVYYCNIDVIFVMFNIFSM